MIRLFVSLKIPNYVLNKLEKLRKNIFENSEKYNWEKEEKIHLTLKFIGEVNDELVDGISQTLNFIEDYKKINLSLTRFGFFYKKGKPKILWAALSENQNLIELVDEINNKLKKYSIQDKQLKFKAHLTLLRIKNNLPKSFIEDFKNYKMREINFVSDEAALIKSDLLPQGSKYIEIKKYKLK